MSYYTTVPGPDILHNVIVYQIFNFFVNLLFFIIDKMSLRSDENGFAGRIWSAGRSLVTPAFDHSLQQSMFGAFSQTPTIRIKAGFKKRRRNQ